MLSDWHRFDRVVIAAAVVLTGVLFTGQAADPVNVIKMTALALCALALIASTAARAVRRRVVHLPVGPGAIAGAALLSAFVVATITAPVTTTAVLGSYGRNSGLITYGSALVLFLVGLRAFERRSASAPLIALLISGAFTASYGLLQYVGIDAVPWNNPFNPIIASLGNPNFAAAYLAICTPAAVWGALRKQWSAPWRVISGVVAGLCVLAAVLSEAAQGPLALAPGLAVLALAWVSEQRGRVRRLGMGALVSLTTVGALGLVAGILGAGPAASVFRDAGSRARLYYWEAALNMWQNQPLLGVGLDTYGGYWRAVRSADAVRAIAASDFTDSAHSVPLHLLATGGLLLGVAYAGFVGVVATCLVLGLRRLSGQDRLLIGALGGSWVAYQVQSLVSIDQVPLTVTQYVLAATIVVVGGWSRLREIRLPGAPALPVVAAGKKPRRAPVQQARSRVVTPSDYALLSVVAVASAVGAWFALVPLRANAAIVNANASAAAGDTKAALASYEQATELVPGQSLYWQKRGEFLQKAQRQDLALAAYRDAAAADPFDLNATRVAAELSERQNRIDQARLLFEEVLRLDPRGPASALAVANFELRHGGAERARELLESATAVTPERADLWAALGDARAETADREGAREAYQRALALQAGEARATAGLAKLGAQA